MAVYAVIGAFSATLDFILFLILKGIFPVLLANTISVTIGILTSYALNSRITFRSSGASKYAIFRFFAVGIFGLIVSNISLLLLTALLEFPEGPSKLVTLPVVALMQFMLNKFWTFSAAKTSI